MMMSSSAAAGSRQQARDVDVDVGVVLPTTATARTRVLHRQQQTCNHRHRLGSGYDSSSSSGSSSSDDAFSGDAGRFVAGKRRNVQTTTGMQTLQSAIMQDKDVTKVEDVRQGTGVEVAGISSSSVDAKKAGTGAGAAAAASACIPSGGGTASASSTMVSMRTEQQPEQQMRMQGGRRGRGQQPPRKSRRRVHIATAMHASTGAGTGTGTGTATGSRSTGASVAYMYSSSSSSSEDDEDDCMHQMMMMGDGGDENFGGSSSRGRHANSSSDQNNNTNGKVMVMKTKDKENKKENEKMTSGRRKKNKGQRRVTISGDGPAVAIIPRRSSGSGGSGGGDGSGDKKDQQQKMDGSIQSASGASGASSSTTTAAGRRPQPPTSILRKSKAVVGLGTDMYQGGNGDANSGGRRGTTGSGSLSASASANANVKTIASRQRKVAAGTGTGTIRPIRGTAGVLARLAAGSSSASTSGSRAPSAKALASRRRALATSTAGNVAAPPDDGGTVGRAYKTPSALASSRNNQNKASGKSTLGADAILPSPSTDTLRANVCGFHCHDMGDAKKGDDEPAIDTEAEEKILRSTKNRLSFATSLPLSGLEKESDNDGGDDDDDAAIFADDESDASSFVHTQNRPNGKPTSTSGRHRDSNRQSQTQRQLSSSSSRPRSKRPTPMDLAWRQVALDEKEGRIPEFVAETEIEKRMERLSENARRDGAELRRIQQLNRDGNEDAYLDALGEYLSRHRKERRKKENTKKGEDALASNKRRRKVHRSSVSTVQGIRPDDESSDAFSSCSASVASETSGDAISTFKRKGRREGNVTKRAKSVGSSKVEETEMSVSSSASSSEEENPESVPPLGSMLQLKWRGTTELQSIANEHRLFVVQYKATYHNSNKSIRDAATPSSETHRNSAKIRPGDLIIKARSAHPLNGSSETVCSFANWTLPGISNISQRKTRSADAMVMASLKPIISESVRRSSSIGIGGKQRREGTQSPPLFLDRDLSFEDKAKVRSFLTDASPGSTPLQFFSRQPGPSKKFAKGSGKGRTKKTQDVGEMADKFDLSDLEGSDLAKDMSGSEIETKAQPMEEDEESNAVDKKDRIDELEYTSTVDAGVNGRAGQIFSSKNEPRSRKVPPSSIGRRRPVLGKSQLVDRPGGILKPPNTKETTTGGGKATGISNLTPRTRTARATAKKKRKHEEVSNHAEVPPKIPNKRTYESRARKKVCHRRITFSCNELPGSDAGTASCFGLIEGVGGGKSELENADSHPLDRYLPFRGKIMETPGAVAIGNWTSAVVEDHIPSHRPSSSRAVLRDTVADLRGIRIELRHQDAKKGPLKDLFGSDSSLTFSVFNPRCSRTSGFRSQGVLDEDEIKEIEGAKDGRKLVGRDGVPFVGSISFALLRGGFHSMSQQNAEGAKRAEDLLDGVRLLADKDRFKQGRGDFLPLCDVNDKDETVIGVSFPCNVECVDDYWVILAQDDESQAIIGVDVVFEDPNLVVPDEQSLALESGTSVLSISESTRTARANRVKEAVLPLTAENLIRHDRELREVEEEETESGEERYDDEILSSSSSEASSLATSRTPFMDDPTPYQQDDQSFSSSSQFSCHGNQESQGSNRRNNDDDLVTPKNRDDAKFLETRRTGTTKCPSSVDGGSDGTHPADEDEVDLIQRCGDEALSTGGGDWEETSDKNHNKIADFDADSHGEDAGAFEEQRGIVAVEPDSEAPDNDRASHGGDETISAPMAEHTCGNDSTSASSNKKSLPGSAVLDVEWAENLDNSGALAHQLALSRESPKGHPRTLIQGGPRDEIDTQREWTGSESKVLEVYQVSREEGSMGQTSSFTAQDNDSALEPVVTSAQGASPGSSISSMMPQESSVETVEYPMPTDTPPESQRQQEPKSSLPSNIIRPSYDDDSLSSCDWEVQQIQEEVFSTPDQPRGDVTVPGNIALQTDARSTPSFFLTPDVHSAGAREQYETSASSHEQQLDLADMLGAEAKTDKGKEPIRPWMVHSAIFGAQDVGTTSSFSPIREDEMVQEPEVLATVPFYWESPGVLSGELSPSTRSIEPLPAHSLIFGGQDSDRNNGILSPQNPALTESKSTILATMPFYLEVNDREKKHPDTTLIGSPSKSPHLPCAFHTLLYGQGGTPEEELSPRSSNFCKDQAILALTPFFLESPGTANKGGEGCVSRDARTIVFGAQDQESSPSEGEYLTGSEPIFTKEPGNILARPIFMSSASYDENEEYIHSPKLNLREVMYRGDENETVDSALDTSRMNMASSLDSCLLPFFIEFGAETEGERPQKRPQRRGNSAPPGLRSILSLLGVALLLMPASTPPLAVSVRASYGKASDPLNQCLLPPLTAKGQTKNPGNLRSF